MKFPKDYLLLVLFLTTVAGGVLAWRQYNELIDLRAAAMNSNERADWQKRLWDAEKNRKALEARVTELEQKPAPATDDAAAVARPANRRTNRGPGDRASEFMALMEKPEMQRLVTLERKGALDARFAPLFKNLNLTPEQLDKFKNLLVEKQTSMMDVAAAAREQGINPRTDPAAFKQMVSDAQNEIDASIKATLGDAAFSQYQSYEQTQPQRNTVNQLEQRLSYSSTPLTDAQSSQLVSILAANSANSANDNPARMMFGGAGGPGGSTKITDATIAAAQGVLTAPQVTALQQLQQEQQAQAALAKTMREQFNATRNQGGSTGGTAAPAPTTKTGGG
ncbi:MAG: hypothetical protein JSS11_15470 [Verrucomicrobia bacterium]|nr:hypothetical protein [Verrucomicrobiota bacterium]